jgi:transcription antitermination factor NusG
MWFAINTRVRYEEFAAKQIEGRGYEVFLPTYKSRRRWSDRIKELTLPLFPGYLFCRFEVAKRFPVLTAPGVLQIVGIGKIPTPVDEAEIGAIQVAAEQHLVREPWPYAARIGQRVRVEAGPLRGVEGIVQNIKGQRRLILSVSLLQRSVVVEIENSWVAATPVEIDYAAARRETSDSRQSQRLNSR